MTIGKICQREVDLAHLEESVQRAAGRDPGTTRVQEIMTTDPRTVHEGMPIERALALMHALEVRRLPVVGEGGKLVGIVGVDDILSLLAEEFREIGRLLEAESPGRLAAS